MQKYSKAEDRIILKHLKAASRPTGTPLNIRAALDAAGDEIFETLGTNRTIGALSVRYYTKLRRRAELFGFQNIKNTAKPKKGIVAPATVYLKGRAYQLTLNLEPAFVEELLHEN